MSRFFELLSERGGARADGASGDARPVAKAAVLVDSRDPESGVSKTASASKQNALPEMERLLDAELGRSPDASPADPEAPAVEADVRLDAQARLIPQALDSSVGEYYRRLRTKILQQRNFKPFRTLLVTSANPDEGKTVTVLNLGMSLALLPGFKVLVVDGDLRKSSFAKVLGMEKRPGFSNLIDGTAKAQDVILKNSEIPMHFMLAGNSLVPAGELLHSENVAKCLRELGEEYSLVLIDSPPLNLLTDTQLLAASADAVLLVTRAYRSKRKSVEKAAQELAGFRVIGTVLNGGRPVDVYGGYKHYYR